MPDRQVLSVDFDGVLHSYASGWKGVDVIPDPPVPGAMAFLEEAVRHFDVQIFSSRSKEAKGIEAMQHWIRHHYSRLLIKSEPEVNAFMAQLGWPTDKPPAHPSVD